MIDSQWKLVARRAKKRCESRYRSSLEAECSGKFAAIVPESGDVFMSDRLHEAVDEALTTCPERLTHDSHRTLDRIHPGTMLLGKKTSTINDGSHHLTIE